MSRPISVMHVWERYVPGLFEQSHPESLKHADFKSLLVTARWIDTGAPLHPNSFFAYRLSVKKGSAPSPLDKVTERIQELTLWRKFQALCREKAAEFQPDVIHVHYGTTGVKLLPLLRSQKKPFLISYYGYDVSEVIRLPKIQKAYRELGELAQRLVVLCEQAKVRLVALGCPREKIVIQNLPAGVEKYPYQPRSITDAQVRFLMCARFVKKKGYRFLLEATERLKSEKREFSVTLLGYGPMKPALEREIQTRGLNDYVKIIDTALCADFDAVYQNALNHHDVFVLPSTTAANGDDEGGPALTLVCAQAAGLPVLCTPFPGAEISVIDGKTGILCRQDDAGSLAEKMVWLMNHRAEWNRLGKSGSDLVADLFPLAKQMAKQFQIYRELAQPRHGGRLTNIIATPDIQSLHP